MGENNKNNGEQKKKDGGKNDVVRTVVLKMDLHCEGCATKVLKSIRSFEGVETASIDDKQKITVVGRLDPVELRDKVEKKTHKKIELVSPQPKKDNSNGDNKENCKGKGNENSNKIEDTKYGTKEKNDKDGSKSEVKKSKPKQPPITTAVFKVQLHCEGCIQKIFKIVTKTKGYEEMKVDKGKELVTVTGAIDMKALAEVLKKHLKKNVEIVPPKKEAEKKEKGDGGEKAKDGGHGGEKGKGCGSGGEKGKGCGGKGNGGEAAMDMNGQQMQVGYPYPHPFVYLPGFMGDPQFHYNPYAVGPYNAPQMFSDENPNACTVM